LRLEDPTDRQQAGMGILMRTIRWLLPTILIVAPLCAALGAEEGPHWVANLETAKRLAIQTNRLVLVHFWAPWCGPCKKLESNVFEQPGVAQSMEARFVLVKINADEFPATTRLYGIERLPTDVVLAPSGQVVKLSCPQDPTQYVAQLNQAAASIAGGAPAGPPSAPQNVYAQAPALPVSPITNPVRGGLANNSSGNFTGSQPAPQTDSGGSSIYSNERYASYLNRNGAAAANPGNPAFSTPGGPVAAPVLVQSAPPDQTFGPGPSDRQNPGWSPPATTAPRQAEPSQASAAPAAHLGLDGFCPVTLVERSRLAPQDPRCWSRGDPRWGAVHRGMTYLFVGPEEQKRFLENPDRYSPVLSGRDPVWAFDKGQMLDGRREFGIFFENRIYLFSGNETLDAFRQNPRRYVEEVRQAEAPPHSAMR
jgi:thiol-disulfide isomerase/thioredoxin/YHS domain-containing protein